MNDANRQSPPAGLPHPYPDHLLRRFLTDNPVSYSTAIEAAESYVSKMGEYGYTYWLHAKPFDSAPGNAEYFRLMYDLLNILQAMRIPSGGSILEVGSGPGWITEILLLLGFSVDALEPCADMLAIAKERCSTLHAHYRQSAQPDVRFHQATLEEVAFEEGRFDAILCFDVLHHVVDEERALEKVFRFLKPGGCLGVVEGSWHPDNKQLEAGLILEMERFGTLENPFSTEYLDYLLEKSGFIDINRYVSVNGFFTAAQLGQPLQSFSGEVKDSNNIIARKPTVDEALYPHCTDCRFRTDVRIRLLEGGIDPVSRTASLVVELENCGETRLDNTVTRIGHSTLALRWGSPGSSQFRECAKRHMLSASLSPGQTLQMSCLFLLPAEVPLEGWELDLIAEAVFWFSSRGIPSCPVPCLKQ